MARPVSPPAGFAATSGDLMGMFLGYGLPMGVATAAFLAFSAAWMHAQAVTAALPAS